VWDVAYGGIVEGVGCRKGSKRDGAPSARARACAAVAGGRAACVEAEDVSLREQRGRVKVAAGCLFLVLQRHA
jgi:hypothetical protein